MLVQAGADSTLQVGQLYSAEVTALLDGKTELLIGNRYLLAATPFNFSVGDRLTLRLAQQSPQLLTFQLALPGTGTLAVDPGAGAVDLATLLRATGLADTAANRSALTTLLQAGIPLTQQTFDTIQQLMAALPGLPLAGFLPLYKELLNRELRPSQAVLRQLALLSLQRPETAALLASAVPLRPAGRPRRGSADAASDSPAGLDAAASEQDPQAQTAAELQALVRLLYSSPEHQLAQALTGARAATEHAGQVTVELFDTANVQPRRGSLDDDAGLALATALRVRSALTPGQGSLSVPLELDGEPVELRLDYRQLAQRFYQRDFHLRLSLQTAAQGPVEVLLHTHGAGLSVSILAGDAGTADAYQAELDSLREQLEQGDTGYVLHKLEAEVASLGLNAPVAEALP